MISPERNPAPFTTLCSNVYSVTHDCVPSGLLGAAMCIGAAEDNHGQSSMQCSTVMSLALHLSPEIPPAACSATAARLGSCAVRHMSSLPQGTLATVHQELMWVRATGYSHE